VFDFIVNFFRKDQLSKIIKYLEKQPESRFLKLTHADIDTYIDTLPNLENYLGWGRCAYLIQIGKKQVMFLVESSWDVPPPFYLKPFVSMCLGIPVLTDLNEADVTIPVADKRLKKRLYKKAYRIDQYLEKIAQDKVIEDITTSILDEDLLKLEALVNKFQGRK
jgi:hypothetical protein